MVSELVLGTVQWGQPYGIANQTGQPTERDVAGMLDAARRAGVRSLDTARAYGNSEAVIGRLVGKELSWRILTKVDPLVSNDGVASRLEALSRLDASLESSRRALQRDVLDGLLLHRASHRTDAGGAVWERMCELRNAGTVRAIGVSVGSPDEAHRALLDPDVDMIQVAASALDQRLIRAGFFARARERAKEVFVRSVFLQGAALMAPRALPQHLATAAPALSALASIARSAGSSLAALLIAFARDATGCSLVIGAETARQLAEIIDAWAVPRLPAATLEDVRGAVPDLTEEVLNPARWPKL